MQVIKRHKVSCVLFFVLAVFMLALLLGLHFATGLGQEEISVIATVWGLFGILVLFFIGFAIREIFVMNTIKRNLADPMTLSHATYGEGNGGKYVFFTTVLDKAAQSAMNVAANVVGVATFLLGGVGVFGFNIQYTDVFVSTDEIILNNSAKNPKLQDEKFQRIPASNIDRVQVEQKGKNAIVTIYPTGGKPYSMKAPASNELLSVLQRMKTKTNEGGRDPFSGFAV